MNTIRCLIEILWIVAIWWEHLRVVLFISRTSVLNFIDVGTMNAPWSQVQGLHVAKLRQIMGRVLPEWIHTRVGARQCASQRFSIECQIWESTPRNGFTSWGTIQHETHRLSGEVSNHKCHRLIPSLGYPECFGTIAGVATRWFVRGPLEDFCAEECLAGKCVLRKRSK